MLSSSRFTVSLVEVETQWSLDDLWAAHAVLDALDHADWLASQGGDK